MNNVFVLTDQLYENPYSKCNNFTFEWIKWYPSVKIAPMGYTFNEGDIVIINLDEATDPHKSYTFNKNKKIYIVHKLTPTNLSYLKDAFHVIYMNDILHKISSTNGVKHAVGKSSICPHHPEFIVPDTHVNKLDTIYVGGRFTESRSEDIYNFLIKTESKISKSFIFDINFIWGNSSSRYDALIAMITKVKSHFNIKQREILFDGKQHPLFTTLFKARTAKSACLYSDLPSASSVLQMLKTSPNKALELGVEESMMLSLFKSARCNIIAGDHVNFMSRDYTHGGYTYNQFAIDIFNIIKNI